ELAELLAIPVLDQGNRLNFPNQHPLALAEIDDEVLAQADFILALDTLDLYGALHSVDRLTRATQPLYPASARIAHVTLDNYLMHSWSNDFRQLQPTDDLIAADTAVFVPQLLARVRELRGSEHDANVNARRDRWSARAAQLRAQHLAKAEKQRGEE